MSHDFIDTRRSDRHWCLARAIRLTATAGRAPGRGRGCGTCRTGRAWPAPVAERVPLGVAVRQRVRRLEVQLAPVRPAGVVVHDLLDALEVGLVRRSDVLVDGDPAGRRAVRGRQGDVVGRRAPAPRSGTAAGTAACARVRRSARSHRARHRTGCRTPSRGSGRGAGCRRSGRCGRSARVPAAAEVTSLATFGASEGKRRPTRQTVPNAEVLADPLVADVGQPRLRSRPPRRCGCCASPGSDVRPASSRTRRDRSSA